MDATVYYDGECPFCSRYVRLQQLRRTLNSLELVDLRVDQSKRDWLASQGFDLDKGMVLDLDGQLYAGEQAAHRLALLGSRNSCLGHINRAVLGTKFGATLAYPILRLGRNATLLVLGRTPLQVDPADQRAWQILVLMSWGLFAYLHVLVYAYQYDATMWLTTWAIAPLGVALFYFPLSRRLLLALLLCMAVDAWRQMPSLSNHTILKNTFLLALLLAGAWHAISGGRWRDVLNDAAPIGRAALLCMYIFGVFHKINTDFLNPEVSCAVALWQQMPALLAWIEAPWFHWLSIYGTLVIESVILLCLLFTRTRHAGIILGIGFHALLAMSGYAIYAAFSTLTITLHLLFLDRASAEQIVASPMWRKLMVQLRSPSGLVVSSLWFISLAVLAWNQSFSSIGVLWLPVIGVLCYAIARYGKPKDEQIGSGAQRLFWSRQWWLNALSVLFFVSCLSPYLGLKTAQSMNMFANLRLEAGESNHLIFSRPPGPFDYLADTVEITASSDSTYLRYIQRNDLRLTYYSLLDRLEREPQASVSFIRRHESLDHQNAASLQEEISAVLHPRWVRNLFHFNPVDLTRPKPCAIDR